MKRRPHLLRGGFDPTSVEGYPEEFVDDFSLPTVERRLRWDAWMEQRERWLEGRAREARKAGWADASPGDFAALGRIPDMPFDGSEL